MFSRRLRPFSLLVLLLALSACSGGKNETNALVVTVGNSRGHATFKIKCDPPSGNAPDPADLCRAIQEYEDPMLTEKYPVPLCGGLDPIDIRVSGRWDGKAIDARVDACSGNNAGEVLWLTHLGNPSFGQQFEAPMFPSSLIP